MKHIFYILLILLAFILTSCPDEDPVKPKPDPCEGKKPVTADIIVKQKVSNYIVDSTIWIPTDTLPINRVVLFEAIGNYDYYEWQIIGDTTKYFNKKQTFQFDYPWGELNIRLIVRSTPDTLCFPDDDGVDTILKKILIVNREKLAINGSYFGHHEGNPLDTFTVDIKYEGGNRGMVIYNLNKGCYIPKNIKSPEVVIINGFCNHTFIFKGIYPAFGCETPTGKAQLDVSNGIITIDYEAGPTNDRKKYKFIGVKQ